jgi:hypothetical protein
MPALPKKFYFDTSQGREWEPFWGGLWQRAREAVERADELVIIGYRVADEDQCAQRLLFGTTNKSVPLTICCGSATTRLEQKFRDEKFKQIRHIADATFAGFLKQYAA